MVESSLSGFVPSPPSPHEGRGGETRDLSLLRSKRGKRRKGRHSYFPRPLSSVIDRGKGKSCRRGARRGMGKNSLLAVWKKGRSGRIPW